MKPCFFHWRSSHSLNHTVGGAKCPWKHLSAERKRKSSAAWFCCLMLLYFIACVEPSPTSFQLPFSHCSTFSSRFVSPQTGSSSRYMGQQNSPVPSPYTPQSPATGYIQQYPHQQPPSYNQHQQIQQGERGCECVDEWRDGGQHAESTV